MAVNHHPNREKKSFKEYYLEFLMTALLLIQSVNPGISSGNFSNSIKSFTNKFPPDIGFYLLPIRYHFAKNQ
jgi:hypothetical protein